MKKIKRSCYGLRFPGSAAGVSSDSSFARRAPFLDEVLWLVIGVPLAPVLALLWAAAIIFNVIRVALREVTRKEART